jgi:hypothetical protein
VSFSRQQAGIQDLTIEFPLTPYRGMGREAGYNAIYFWSVVHCWVKNVAIINADMAVTLDGTHFCTVSKTLVLERGFPLLVESLNSEARSMRCDVM